MLMGMSRPLVFDVVLKLSGLTTSGTQLPICSSTRDKELKLHVYRSSRESSPAVRMLDRH